MREFGAGPATIQHALDRLAHEKIIEAHPGRGTFVGARPQGPAPIPADTAWQSVALGAGRSQAEALAALALVPPPHAIPLNAGYLPEALQATSLIAAATSRALRQPGLWNRMPTEGLHALRACFATSIGSYRTHEITICPGSQSALAASFRALANAGDPVLMESPTFVGAIAAARSAGLRPVPVPTDRDGVRPEFLADAFRTTGARLFYCQPTYSNPTGSVLSAERRGIVIDMLAEFGAFLIEDDWARDFPLDSNPPPPLAADDRDGHVIYVRSLTKCAAPGLRIGVICARGAALGRLRAARLTDDFFVPGLLQEIALQLITAPGWPRHLRGLRVALRAQRDALAAALRTHLGPECVTHLPEGGLHLWVRLPEDMSDADIAARCARADILVSPGRDWFPADPEAAFLRVSFAAIAPDTADDAIARLVGVIHG